jgi:hypothetical protein
MNFDWAQILRDALVAIGLALVLGVAIYFFRL